MTTLFENRVWKLSTRYYRVLEIFQALNKLDTIDTLADDLDLIVAQFRERVAYLKAFS
jgi:hypothetical protein